MSPKEPLYSQLYAIMADRIRTGVWAEGERVPSESVLLEEFGTSRGPVRQALAQLRLEGLIVGRPGARPRVQKAVPTQSFDTYVSFTEWAEALGCEPGQKTIEAARRLADGGLAAELQVPEGSSVVEVLRLRSLDGDPVMLERSIYPYEVGRHLLAVDLDVSSIYQTLLEQNIYPVRARNLIEAIAATELDARWLQAEVGSPLLRVRRTSLDKDGAVVDLVDNHYLPNKAAFAVENTRHNRMPITRTLIDNGK